MAVFDAVSYTVKLVLFTPTSLGEAGDWTWSTGELIGLEYVFTACEVATALRVWGRIVAMTLIKGRHDRFALAALTADSNALVGRDTWIRSAETHRLIPHGAPLVVWDAVMGSQRQWAEAA
jgi:hypothetical protein